jgi:hypothetical protein
MSNIVEFKAPKPIKSKVTDYESMAIKEAKHELSRKEPLDLAKDGVTSLTAQLTHNRNHVIDMVSWLFNGSYGFGHMKIALDTWEARSNDRQGAIMVFSHWCKVEHRLNHHHKMKVLNSVMDKQQLEDFTNSLIKELSDYYDMLMEEEDDYE